MMEKMSASQCFRAVAEGKPCDRFPMIEWAMWWDKTTDKWYNQGLPRAVTPGLALQEHFGLDKSLQWWFPTTTAESPTAPSHGAPLVKNAAEYQKYKHTFYPDPVIHPGFLEECKKTAAVGNGVFWYSVDGYFWWPRTLLGIENHLFAFYDEKELYQEICYDLSAWHRRVIEYCGNVFPFDFMTFAEDMSYNLGPMIGEDLFDEFLLPHYLSVMPLVKRNGTKAIVDSDGDITKAVEWYARAGADGMLPLERQAGVDVSRYIESRPEMLFIGHFDKMIMHKGEGALRTEFERLLPSMVSGRFLPSVDHQTPPAVSYEDYKLYIRLFREYNAKAAVLRNTRLSADQT